ncbi:hypothetical protein RJ639_035083 [Escallonia herrerae]|uniref:Strictosidine synthase conserved region domain-containing protein n=1 Tax=Escallonia herrerae TaxID=1293975 RepID=A0AA89BBJ9_9ASTE|nr:hypothetical protein RJ639_035083 [Escallonia herrerae]
MENIFSSKTVIMLSIFILFFHLPSVVLSTSTYWETFDVPAGGPESYAFNSTGGGPFTGINDGRIIKYEGCKLYFVNHAFTSPYRTNALCDNTTNPNLGSICGRPLGLDFHLETNELYIADAYRGLCKVGPEGGLATQLVTSANGLPLKWLDGLTVDQLSGNVYFTDVSSKYDLSQIEEHICTGDATGRLIKYNPKTKEVKVLLTGLKGAGGVALSKDSSFILYSEFTGNKISKYWLKGPKATTVETVLNIPGPANIKRTTRGDFWVAVNLKTPSILPVGLRIDEFGTILEKVTFGISFHNKVINEVVEYLGFPDVVSALYVGSTYTNYGGIFEILFDETRSVVGGKLKKCPPEEIASS